MLHILRQNKQCLGTLVLTMLLMVWLTLTCQNCFADTGADAEHASHMHAAMECCPAGHHSDHGQTEFDHNSCGPNYLTNQPVIADNTVMQSGDQTIVLSSVAIHDPFLPPPDGYHNASLDQEIYFSPRLFSSYRLLLI